MDTKNKTFYSQDDSDEIRRAHFESLANNPDKFQTKELITQKEWDDFAAAKQDMSRYEVFTEFQKRMRKQESEEYKKRSEKNRG